MTDLFQLAAKLGSELAREKHLLVTAESCTGGAIAHAITAIPGASRWFDCGLVAYSNHTKIRLLNVPEALIRQHGAVSAQVAAAMAQGALATTNGTIAISTTGIAGPDGATPGKPVGTIWFALAGKHHVRTELQFFSGDRQAIRHQGVKHALTMLLQFLLIHRT